MGQYLDEVHESLDQAKSNEILTKGDIQCPLNNFLENAFSNFFFYFKVQSFRLISAINFIHMVASTSHAVAYTIGPIFKSIIDYVQLYFTNGFTNIVL